MKSNVIVDTRGLFCPVPVIKTSEAIKNIESGRVVEVISDDPAIAQDLPAWCQSTGHRIVSVAQEGQVYRYQVRKK